MRKVYIVLESYCGDGIGEVAQNMRDLAYLKELEVHSEFNGVHLTAQPGCKLSDIILQWESIAAKVEATNV